MTKGTSILLVTFSQTHLPSLSIHGKSNLRRRRPKEIPSSAKLSVSYLWWLLCYECCCSMDLKLYIHKFVKTETTQFDKKTQNLSSVCATTWFSNLQLGYSVCIQCYNCWFPPSDFYLVWDCWYENPFQRWATDEMHPCFNLQGWNFWAIYVESSNILFSWLQLRSSSSLLT